MFIDITKARINKFTYTLAIIYILVFDVAFSIVFFYALFVFFEEILASIFALLITSILLYSLIRRTKYLIEVRRASKFTLSCYSALTNGTRTYEQLAMAGKCKENDVEEILKMCIEKAFITGITLLSAKKMILLSSELSELNETSTIGNTAKIQNKQSLILSCESCGAKTTYETFEVNNIITCEYCGSAITN